jgi:hypothetical protein
MAPPRRPSPPARNSQPLPGTQLMVPGTPSGADDDYRRYLRPTGVNPVTGPRLVVLPWEGLHPWARLPHRF